MLIGAGRLAKRAALRSRSTPTFFPILHPRIPIARQVNPVGIQAFEQRDFLRPAPTLQLFLTRNSLVNVVVGFPIEQALNIVPMRKTFDLVKFVLKDALVKITREPDVKGSGESAEDVYTVRFAG